MTTLPGRERWKQLSPLLDELLELDARALQQRLTTLRMQDTGLADELGSMLRAAGQAEESRFLARTADDGTPY